MAIAIGVFAFHQHQFSAPQKGAETERIAVNLTTTEAELIPKLKEQGYIRSEWAFNYVLKKKGWQGKIQPGGYKVSKGMTCVAVSRSSGKRAIHEMGRDSRRTSQRADRRNYWQRTGLGRSTQKDNWISELHRHEIRRDRRRLLPRHLPHTKRRIHLSRLATDCMHKFNEKFAALRRQIPESKHQVDNGTQDRLNRPERSGGQRRNAIDRGHHLESPA